MRLTIKQLRALIKEALEEKSDLGKGGVWKSPQVPVKDFQLNNPNGGSIPVHITGNNQSGLVVAKVGNSNLLLEPGGAEQLAQALMSLSKYMGMKQ